MMEVVWGVIWMIAILIIAVGVVIVYIFKYDEWYPNGKDDTTVEEELLQLPSDGDSKSS
jgi:hypothetical protein